MDAKESAFLSCLLSGLVLSMGGGLSQALSSPVLCHQAKSPSCYPRQVEPVCVPDLNQQGATFPPSAPLPGEPFQCLMSFHCSFFPLHSLLVSPKILNSLWLSSSQFLCLPSGYYPGPLLWEAGSVICFSLLFSEARALLDSHPSSSVLPHTFSCLEFEFIFLPA